MAKGKKTTVAVTEAPVPVVSETPPAPQVDTSLAIQQLAAAIAQSIVAANQAANPLKKKTLMEYTGKTPFDNADGTPKTKLKRRMFIHSLLIDPDMHTSEEIDLLNRVRPGRYFDGFVLIERRRDKGINITWPIRTRDQMMRLSSQYGITSLAALCRRCIEEAKNPVKVEDHVED